jgi:hypothetical protein
MSNERISRMGKVNPQKKIPEMLTVKVSALRFPRSHENHEDARSSAALA